MALDQPESRIFTWGIITVDTPINVCSKRPCFSEKGAKIVPACVKGYGSFCSRWSLNLLSEGPDIRNSFNYEERGVDFSICKHLKMTLDSQFDPSSHPKQFKKCHTPVFMYQQKALSLPVNVLEFQATRKYLSYQLYQHILSYFKIL